MNEGGQALAERIREELGRRRATRLWLAHEAQLSLSTLEKCLAGRRRFTTATLVRIEAALGVALRERGTAPSGREIAPAELGAYARPAVQWLEGAYFTVRPAFGEPGAIYAYCTHLLWDEAGARLVFRESERADAAYAQRGDVALPHQSGHIYLVTREAGQFRLATLGRPTIARRLSGMLSTLHAGPGGQLIPVSCPILLQPLGAGPPPAYGLFRPGTPSFAPLAALLAGVEGEGFARHVAAPVPPGP